MKGFDNLHIKSAVKSHNKFDLSRTHLTTMQFGQIVPLFVEETVPGDSFNVSANYFSRLAPLAVPTYGKFEFKTATFFVPYYQVADDAEAYLAGKTTWESDYPHGRFISYQTLLDLFTDSAYSTVTTSTTHWDFAYTDAGGTYNKYEFTQFGKYVYKIITALGYNLPQNADTRISSYWTTHFGTSAVSGFLSAYPLLAFFKAYNDWMSQSQRYNGTILTANLRKIKHNQALSGYNTNNGHIGVLPLKSMFNSVRLNYDNDYFISAWQSPNNPLNTPESLTSVTVPGQTTLVPNSNDTVGQDALVTALTPYTSGTINQKALDFLKSFDDWVRRNNYSGSRVVQQIYSKFGIKTEDFRSNYAQAIDTDVMPVQVGDVTSTSDTAGASLGEYAGKGIMSGNHGFSFKSSDYGFLMVFGYFTVRPMMSYGTDRHCLRNQPLDYYNPEFDGVGPDVISYGEIFQNPTSPSGDSYLDDAIYGFTERYNSYRFGRDKITGEFRDYNSNANMNSWHTGRLLEDVRKGGNMVAQSTSMNVVSPTDSEYNRIFSVTSGTVDHFYLTCQFKVDAVRPMLSLNQVPKLGEGDTNVPRNGNVIS